MTNNHLEYLYVHSFHIHILPPNTLTHLHTPFISNTGTFRENGEFIVERQGGGRWRFKLVLEAEEPEVDDVITIEAPIHRTASVSFELNNITASSSTFRAFFTSQSAPQFELRLKGRELQKNLFDYIGAGTTSPKFLTKKLYTEENSKLEIKYLNLDSFYKKKEEISDKDIQRFLDENQEQLKVEYLDFDYAIVNPKNLIGVDEFNQAFFDKIDEIEINISNNLDFKTIVNNLNIKPVAVTDFRYSDKQNEVEKKIFEAKKIEFDLLENDNNYILYKINKIEERSPNIKDLDLKKEILELISQKNKFDYNNDLLMKINNKTFNQDQFNKMGQDITQSITLNSIKDNNRFNINAVELLYSLPINSFTLINDDESKIYLAKIIKFEDKKIENDNENYTQYIGKQNTNNKTNILQSYDIFLNDKYDVVLNQQTIKRVKNFFQ